MPPRLVSERPTGSAAEKQLRQFLAKFDTRDQRLIRSVRRAVRQRLAGAYELVYDNYNFFVIGYSPTERPSDAILSITARANSVGLCFVRGAMLPDPKGLLRGSGNQTRSIRVDAPSMFAKPEVEALIAAAVAQNKVSLPSNGTGRLIIRSVSLKQRPRRKSSE